MRPSRALQETSHIVFVTSPRNLSRGRGTIDNVDVSLHLLSCTRQARYRDTDSEIACISFLFSFSLFKNYDYISISFRYTFLPSLYLYGNFVYFRYKRYDFLSSLTYFMLMQLILFFLILYILSSIFILLRSLLDIYNK